MPIGYFNYQDNIEHIAERMCKLDLLARCKGGGMPCQSHRAMAVYLLADDDNPAPTWLGNHLFYNKTENGLQEAHRAYGLLVSSLCEDGLHRPILDFDYAVKNFPSTTPGHYHGYFDRPMRWDTYAELLTQLARFGIISRTYLDHSLRDKMTLLYKP